MNGLSRRAGLVLASGIAQLAISIPVLAASPAPSGAPTKESKSEKPGKPDNGPETAISLKGTVQVSVDADGMRPTR